MHRKAERHLKRADPRLAAIIERVGPCRMEPRREGTHFDAIIRAIVYQQLSGKAAATILGRVLGLFGGRSPTPGELAAVPDEPLRAAGLSRQKIGYLRDLAAKVASGHVPMDTLDEEPDDSVIDSLVRIKGVGRWTAQMFLMFRLGRPNVLPDLDLGIQKGIQRAYRLRTMPSPEKVREIGAKWGPHASVASWYLWRSLDNGDGQAGAPVPRATTPRARPTPLSGKSRSKKAASRPRKAARPRSKKGTGAASRRRTPAPSR